MRDAGDVVVAVAGFGGGAAVALDGVAAEPGDGDAAAPGGVAAAVLSFVSVVAGGAEPGGAAVAPLSVVAAAEPAGAAALVEAAAEEPEDCAVAVPEELVERFVAAAAVHVFAADPVDFAAVVPEGFVVGAPVHSAVVAWMDAAFVLVDSVAVSVNAVVVVPEGGCVADLAGG